MAALVVTVAVVLGQIVDRSPGRTTGSRQPTVQASAGPLTVKASGRAPWKIAGNGYIFEITKVRHTSTTPWMGQPTRSLTVDGYVTRTDPDAREAAAWDLRDQDGNRLDVPVGPVARIVWEDMPTLGQRLPFTLVVYDPQRAKSLKFTVTIYFHDTTALILLGIPVPRNGAD